MSQPETLGKRIILGLFLLVAISGAFLMATPRRAGGAAGGCKANGAFCKTNESCCSGVCTANVCGPRFVDNGDGTVTDNETGLQWEKKTGTEGTPVHCDTAPCSDPHDVNNLYSWSSSGIAADGLAFTDFLSRLNACTSDDGSTVTAVFAGHCDWRLPSIAELKTIVDLSAPGCGSGSPCIDPIFGPTRASFYSSSTTAGLSFVWLLKFDNGFVSFHIKTNSLFFVRAVRGGS